MLERPYPAALAAPTLIEQVMAEMGARVVSRELAPGARLPSIR